MTFRFFLQIHLLFGALLFSCNVFSNPVVGQQEGASLPPGSLITWSDTDVGSDYWAHVGTSPGAKDILDSGNISNQMSITVGDWPAEFFVRLWYRPTGMAWDFVDTRFTSESCPAPVKEQYDMVKERVDNGVLVAKEGEPFNGLYCSVLYGVDGDDDDEFNYNIVVVVDQESGLGDPFHPNVVPASVSAQGLRLWMTKGEARACANYIDC